MSYRQRVALAFKLPVAVTTATFFSLSVVPALCHEHFLYEMEPVNIYQVLQGILEVIEPGNCAIVLYSFSPPAM